MIREIEETESTNSYVLEHASELDDWDIVIARRQSGGRGRNGHAWMSPEGGLWMSIVLKGEHFPQLPLLAGLAVADVLMEMGLNPCCLKWPNDVLVKEKKIAGILVERKRDVSAVGIGLNCNFHAEELGELAESSTTVLDEIGMEKNIALVAEAIAGSLRDMVERSDRLPLWRFLSCTLGRRVRIESTETFEGIAEDIDESGALLVRTDDGVKKVISGDCIHL